LQRGIAIYEAGAPTPRDLPIVLRASDARVELSRTDGCGAGQWARGARPFHGAHDTIEQHAVALSRTL
jgi:hypothetical protein